MKKLKKKTVAQKKRAKAKAKLKAEEQKRGNWVLDRLDWIKGSADYHSDNNNDNDKKAGVNNNNDVEVDNIITTVDDNDKRHQQQQQQDTHDISIISWNVLADSYCSRSSHKNLPSKVQSQIFNRKQRQHDVRQTLRLLDAKLMPDLIGLQEVDPPLEISKCMESLGYGVVETLASPDGRNGRVDSCGLYYRESQWTCLDYETIRLDDIAILRSLSTSSEASETDNTTDKTTTATKKRSRDRNSSSSSTSHPNSGSLKGLQRSFVRKNVALLVQLGHIPTGRRVVVVVAHLFWNPAYEYVKLCQTHYVAIRAEAFRREKNNNDIKDVSVIWCGDFNSQPGGSVHQYLTTGVVNAKAIAPWYDTITSREQRQEKQNYNNSNNSNNTTSMDITDSIDDDDEYDDDCQDMTGNLDRLNLSENNNTSDAIIIDNNNQKSDDIIAFPKVKYMLDYTLNRLCRWLRILGIDAAIETEEEEIERTRDANITLFRRCKEEGRSLVTTASKLLLRKDCPPGTYLLDQNSLLNLELSLVHLLLSHGVKLEPAKMLTRCVVCNGNIEPVYGAAEKQEIFDSYQGPDQVDAEVLNVYRCDGCSQGYWWCEKPTSSASRVKSRATKLLESCISGGVPVDDDLGMFSHIDVEKVRDGEKEADKDNEVVSLNKERLDVVQWLQTENLRNPLQLMASAYASKDTRKESLSFTNVTFDFVGHLDYILYETQAMEVTDLLYVPKTFDELNDLGIPHGHLLPSCDWPSDHLGIGCRLSFRSPPKDVDESSILFPPLPPMSVPWCSVIDESKTDEVSPTSSAAHIRRLIESQQSKSKTKFVNPATLLPHGKRCGCGCIPPVPSLFEMAELRRQYKLRLKEEENDIAKEA